MATGRTEKSMGSLAVFIFACIVLAALLFIEGNGPFLSRHPMSAIMITGISAAMAGIGSGVIFAKLARGTTPLVGWLFLMIAVIAGLEGVLKLVPVRITGYWQIAHHQPIYPPALTGARLELWVMVWMSCMLITSAFVYACRQRRRLVRRAAKSEQ